MFKSIEYKLLLYLALLIAAVAGATWCFADGRAAYGTGCLLVVLFALGRLRRHYKKFNSNVLFLFNALENGDYSFRFSTTKVSRREKELNNLLNRIKEVLTRAREEVMGNERFLSVVMESVSTGIVIAEERGGVRSVNRAAMQMLGMGVFTHLTQLRSIDESFPALFRELRDEEHARITIPNEREEIRISLSASEVTINGRRLRIITMNNIGSDLEAQEMESWVKLIRVITHEIMNSIAPITSLSDTIRDMWRDRPAPEADPVLRDNTVAALETIATTARGLLAFVDSYRGFSGIPAPELRPVDVAALLDGVVQLEARGVAERNITLETDLSVAPGEVAADEPQITRVLVNLIRNAAEAIDPHTGGRIVIRAAETDGRPQIDVCNDGVPVPADIAPHIFLPFFTTKDAGTGIGLSVSRYIMRMHGGNLKHRTEEGWTVFSMIF